MKTVYDLSKLSWFLFGTSPYAWKSQADKIAAAEQQLINAAVPGSVQKALRKAGRLPDWNVGLNTRHCEWVENRHWIFQVHLPDEWFVTHKSFLLKANGLDDRGWIFINGQEAGSFHSTHLPRVYDISFALQPTGNILEIVFDCPPRWLGQTGYTSQITDWKARFYYTWDWVPRLVQIGIWDQITLEESTQYCIENLIVHTDLNPEKKSGALQLQASVTAPVGAELRIKLMDDRAVIFEHQLPVCEFQKNGFSLSSIPVELWYPNGMGDQKLYRLKFELVTAQGKVEDQLVRMIGFKKVCWQACDGAPEDADPWICVVNQEPVFLQGFNWTPILPNFADVTEADYRLRLQRYKDMGCNILRMWGGAHLEKEIFFDLCDQMGILVWQEFPLSSSGIDNYPPHDHDSIEELSQIARSYIMRRHHHSCLLMWGGGNELTEFGGNGVPIGLSHPLIHRFAQITDELDPLHRFVATSPSGPSFSAQPADFGKGLHWDVHGPWKASPDLAEWEHYWQACDALFHSEIGCPSASPVHIIERTSGGTPTMPANAANPLWQRTSWWIEWDLYLEQGGKEDSALEDYVRWSQNRQAKALSITARCLKDKFPHCGGVIFWMGHDCFPCTANTSVIDVDGNYKPAALALQEVFMRGYSGFRHPQ